ncbi:MAG: hypothetical protein F6K65_30375 [Moorea sp. SIO3C2]|nr:hypothetical protein [Moorena sp. SIO3C2]
MLNLAQLTSSHPKRWLVGTAKRLAYGHATRTLSSLIAEISNSKGF